MDERMQVLDSEGKPVSVLSTLSIYTNLLDVTCDLAWMNVKGFV